MKQNNETTKLTKTNSHPMTTTPQPATSAKPAQRDAKDAERLDWLQRQDFDNLGLSLVQDRPHDGEYEVETEFGAYYGKTLREAIDAAIASQKGLK